MVRRRTPHIPTTRIITRIINTVNFISSVNSVLALLGHHVCLEVVEFLLGFRVVVNRGWFCCEIGNVRTIRGIVGGWLWTGLGFLGGGYYVDLNRGTSGGLVRLLGVVWAAYWLCLFALLLGLFLELQLSAHWLVLWLLVRCVDFIDISLTHAICLYLALTLQRVLSSLIVLHLEIIEFQRSCC